MIGKSSPFFRPLKNLPKTKPPARGWAHGRRRGSVLFPHDGVLLILWPRPFLPFPKRQVFARGAQFGEGGEVHNGIEDGEKRKGEKHPFGGLVGEEAHFAALGLVDEKEDEEDGGEDDCEVGDDA